MLKKLWAVLARFGGEAPKSAAEEKFRHDETYESELAQERARQAQERLGQPAKPEEEVTIEIPEEEKNEVELDKAA